MSDGHKRLCIEAMADDNSEKMDDRTHGGCEGPDAMYVKLISSDGHEFIIKREHALTSGTIKAMLSGPGESMFQLFLLTNYTNVLCVHRTIC